MASRSATVAQWEDTIEPESKWGFVAPTVIYASSAYLYWLFLLSDTEQGFYSLPSRASPSKQ